MGVAALLLVVGGGALFVPRPEVDNSAPVWVDEAAPAAIAYRRFQADFGADEVFAVRIRAADPRTLKGELRRFHAVLEASPIIERVISADAIFQETDGVPARLDGPLNRALSLWDEENNTALVLGLARISRTDQRDALKRSLEDARRDAARTANVTVRLAGNPLINLELDRAGSDVERISMPILIAVCVLLLLFLTRSVTTTAVALVPAGVIVLGIDAGFTLLGLKANIVSNIVKPLLFVLLLAGTLHIIVGWQDAVAEGIAKRRAPFAAARRKGRGVLFALTTSAVGFGSLALSEVPPIRVFGLFSAAGLMIGVLYLRTVLPSLLAFIPAGHHLARTLADVAVRMVRGSLRGGPILPVIAAITIGVGLYLSLSLKSDPHAIRYFKPSHPLRIDHEALEEEGVGLATAELIIEGKASLLTKTMMDKTGLLADRLRPLAGVNQIISPAVLIAEAAFQSDLPAGALESDAVFSRLIDAHRAALSDFVSEDGKRLRLSLLIRNLDASDLDRLKGDIEAAFDAVFDGGEGLTISGNYEILLSTQAGLLQTLKSSLLLTAGLMTLLFLVFLRSARATLVALIPNLFPVSLNFILMSALDVPLDVGTSMTAAIALGIAVDDTLHFVLEWQRTELLACARSTGRAIILSSVIIGAGFVSLLFSDFTPTRNFGLLCGAAMASALLADLVVLPPLLKWIEPTRRRKAA